MSVTVAEDEGHPEEGVGGSGQADEGVGLAGVEVELGQAVDGEGRDEDGGVDEEGEEPGLVGVGGGEGLEDGDVADEKVGKDGRSKTEADGVGEGVEFFAEGGGDAEEAGREAVEEVEDHGREDGKGGSGQLAVEGKEDGNGAGSGVEAGDEVGYLFFHIGCSYWCDESSVFCRRKEGFLLFSRKNISGT